MGATASGVGRMEAADGLTHSDVFTKRVSAAAASAAAACSPLFLCVSAIGILVAFSEGFAASAPLSLLPFPFSTSFPSAEEPFYDAIISAGAAAGRCPLLRLPQPPPPPTEKESFINERKKATAVTAISLSLSFCLSLSVSLSVSLPLCFPSLLLLGVIARARHYANIMNSHAPVSLSSVPLFLSVQQIRSLAALYLSPSRLYTTICGGGRQGGRSAAQSGGGGPLPLHRRMKRRRQLRTAEKNLLVHEI